MTGDIFCIQRAQIADDLKQNKQQKTEPKTDHQ